MKTKFKLSVFSLSLCFILFCAVHAWGSNQESANSPIPAVEFEGTLQETDTPELTDTITDTIDVIAVNPPTRIALVLSDIYSKKDMEFSRGFLLGMRHSNIEPNSIDLKIINGEIPSDSLRMELDSFVPDFIVSTFEKDAPVALLTYARINDCKLLNVFDARGNDYLYNKNIYQTLTPSAVFNPEVARYLLDNFPGNILVIVGDPDPSDPSMKTLILEWPEDDLLIVAPEDFALLELEEESNYIIYPLVDSNDDVKEILGKIVTLMAAYPTAGVRIFGRPGWIAINDLSSAIANMEVFIPSKCYFDPSTDASKRFISTYNSSFGHAPIRSYPVYAVMGYDIAGYFLPVASDLKENPSLVPDPRNMIQSYFNFTQSENLGVFNRGGFILHYEPWGTMKKELLF